MKSLSRREAFTAGAAALAFMPMAAMASAPISSPDAKIFGLLGHLRQAEAARDAACTRMEAHRKAFGSEPANVDGVLGPLFCGVSDLQTAILQEPAQTMEGLLVKARVALEQISDFDEDGYLEVRPRTPEEAYEVVNALKVDHRSGVLALWADLERMVRRQV